MDASGFMSAEAFVTILAIVAVLFVLLRTRDDTFYGVLGLLLASAVAAVLIGGLGQLIGLSAGTAYAVAAAAVIVAGVFLRWWVNRPAA